MDFLNIRDLTQIARDELLTRNPKLTAAAIDTPGTDVFAIVSAIAAVGDEIVGSQARLQAAILLLHTFGQRRGALRTVAKMCAAHAGNTPVDR